MHSNSPSDRQVLRRLGLLLLTAFVGGCVASAATSVVSQTVKITTKATGAATHTIARFFGGDGQQAS